MLKIVVFDCGYGGELFADQLEESLPVVEVIRVIDWRHANEIQSSPKRARDHAQVALRPYIDRVDLIVFANHLLSATSLKYFQRKYKTQKFLGFHLRKPDTYIKHDVLVLATKPLTRTIIYRDFLFHLKRKIKTLTPDTWPAKIDDGLLTESEIQAELSNIAASGKFNPREVILACSQFSDIKSELRNILGHNLRIYDSFDEAIYQIHKTLKIRGGAIKKNK